jgi:putative hemolysin
MDMKITPTPAPLVVHLAETEKEIEEAQRLRYQVFAEEMGAQLPSAERSLDVDMFDPYCDHLLVRDTRTSQVVGTYRILSPRGARNAGGYYSETEFDLSRLFPLFDDLVEVGRSCVHPDYRNGATIGLLWSGLSRYVRRSSCEYLMGCASIGMQDGGHDAASIFRKLSENKLSPEKWRVFPRQRLPLEDMDAGRDATMPPLVKGYMRLGCYVCGEPAWDPEFNTADLLVLLPMSQMNPRHAKHFFGA